MGKKKKDKNFKKSLKKNIEKLDKDMYKNNKYVNREDFLVAKFPKPMKRYYKSLSEERKKSFLKYIMNQEDYERDTALEKHATRKDDNIIVYKMKTSDTISGAIDELKKQRKFVKKRKKKVDKIIKGKGSKGLYYLLNPEKFDQTLLNKKDYRKYLKEMVKEEKKNTSVELDCTLKNFQKELMKNESVNSEVMDAFSKEGIFFNSYGYND